MRWLEARGYVCTRAAASLGVWDVIAVGPEDVRLIQVKSGQARAGRVEKAAMEAFACPRCCSKELWTWADYAREPEVKRV